MFKNELKILFVGVNELINLVGYTGFVGTNLCRSYNFDNVYNSKNIDDSFGTNPEICIYSGVRSEMFLANSDPEADFNIVNNAIENIKKINPSKIVLISTTAVYDSPINVDESTLINSDNLSAYGKNRRHLETWVEENFSKYLIIRLPALYGKNLKKNFIYDMINVSPSLLTRPKFDELCKKDNFIKDYYILQENSFYKCVNAKAVRPYFQNIGFSALNFTDSRSVFQFYNLKYLWKHINFALKNKINILNSATEPISAGELYEYIFKKKFVNELKKTPFNYNMKTKYFNDGYIFHKDFIIEDVREFIGKHKN